MCSLNDNFSSNHTPRSMWVMCMCMLNHLFDRRTSPQWCILFVALWGTAISRLDGPAVRLSLRYTTPEIHCRDNMRFECDGEIKQVVCVNKR